MNETTMMCTCDAVGGECLVHYEEGEHPQKLNEVVETIARLEAEVMELKATAKAFARAADTEKKEAAHWRSRVEALARALRDAADKCDRRASEAETLMPELASAPAHWAGAYARAQAMRECAEVFRSLAAPGGGEGTPT